ncbi:hypothetical protein D3C85_1501870 [compost metagenome]
MKNVHRVLRAKTASHVASAKSAYVNCVSHWMPLRSPPLPLLPPLKNVRPASHVKNALHAHRVKNVNHVPSKPLPPLPKKS